MPYYNLQKLIVNMKENKSLLLTIVAISTLIVSIVGVTFAYFAASIGNSASSNIKVTTSTLDSLIYTTGDPIKLEATQQNFYEGAPSITGATISTVSLNSNNEEDAKYCYTLDLVINNNNFEYTSDLLTPELKVSITRTKTGGTEETILDDYDITNKEGIINIPVTLNGSMYKNIISAIKGGSSTDSYKATVTFVDLATLQQANEGKKFN